MMRKHAKKHATHRKGAHGAQGRAKAQGRRTGAREPHMEMGNDDMNRGEATS